MSTPTPADLYAWQLSQFSAHDLSRLLFFPLTGSQDTHEIFPHGTHFDQPKITYLISLVRREFPGVPSPALDRFWAKHGAHGVEDSKELGYFMCLETERVRKEAEEKGGGEAGEEVGKREEVTKHGEILAAIASLSSKLDSLNATRQTKIASITAKVADLADQIKAIESVNPAAITLDTLKLTEVDQALLAASAKRSVEEWTEIEGSAVASSTRGGEW